MKNEHEKILDENNFSWIKVKKYVDDSNLSWKERYKALEEHHKKETEFLINKCRELVREFELALDNGYC